MHRSCVTHLILKPFKDVILGDSLQPCFEGDSPLHKRIVISRATSYYITRK
jgi:hypothetical protein